MEVGKSIKESDWKVFCEIKNEAIQLYCSRQLNEVIETITDESELAGERFHFMCQYSKTSEKQMKLIFDGHPRNKAFIQLMLMCEKIWLHQSSSNASRMSSKKTLRRCWKNEHNKAFKTDSQRLAFSLLLQF